MKDGREHSGTRFGDIFATELARSMARGVVMTAGAAVLAGVHWLLG